MKKTHLNLLILLGSLILSLSCNKNGKNDATNDYQNFLLLGKGRTFSTAHYLKAPADDKAAKTTSQLYPTSSTEELFTYYNMPSYEIETLLSDLKANVGGDIQEIEAAPYSITLYMDSETTQTEYGSIKGISMFFENDSHFLHRYFKVTAGNSTEEADVNGLCQKITYADLRGLGYYSNDFTFSPSIIWLKSEENSTVGDTDKEHHYLGRLLYQSPDKYPMHNLVKSSARCVGCGISEGGCDTDSYGQLFCSAAGPCYLTQVNEHLLQTNLPFTPFNLTSGRSFRDEILAETTTGLKYTYYYNELSYFTACFNIARPENFETLYDLATEGYVVRNKFIDEPDDEVILTEPLKSSATSVISLYRDQSINNHITGILDDITVDLDTFVGLQKSELLSLMQ